MKKDQTITNLDAKQTVLDFIEALNHENFSGAKKLVTKDLQFIGILGSRDSADAYFEDMQHMKFKYDIKKVFVDGDDVCLFYDIKMSNTNVFCCGWYHLTDGKIDTLKVLFDPRPVLEASKKN
jgi:hypothetical protein